MLSIIIGTKDRLEYLKALIKSIKEFTKDYELIVIDDCSQDGTGMFLRNFASKKYQYIINANSIPVAHAWNQGAEIANGEYLVFLNDDMLVTEGWAEEQLKAIESLPQVGSMAFKVYDDLGNVQSRGHSFSKLTPYLPDENVFTVDYSDHPFMKKSVWERVGGFKAYGHLYYEDSGMGLKLLSHGLYNYYNPKAVLKHQTVGLRVGTKEDKARRKINETVIQAGSRENFYNEWGSYLENR